MVFWTTILPVLLGFLIGGLSYYFYGRHRSARVYDERDRQPVDFERPRNEGDLL